MRTEIEVAFQFQYSSRTLRFIMSRFLVMSGKSSILSADFEEPLILDSNTEHVLGLVNFETYNSAPNVTEKNNKFYFGNRIITIPVGCYEIKDINAYVTQQLNSKLGESVEIKANNNTLHTQVKCSNKINFQPEDSIGRLLGFAQKELAPNVVHESDFTSSIMSINSMLIYCNITTSSYKDGKLVHILYQFFPKVPAGFKIVEAPQHVIYLPITTKLITNITLKILDQDGNLINFRGETVTVGLHLKQL